MRIPPCGNYGDIDGDGYVTREDGASVGAHVAGIETLNNEQMRRADVDGSGDITLADAVLIGKYGVGYGGYDTFPVCADYKSPTTKMIRVFAVAAVIMYVITKIIWK